MLESGEPGVHSFANSVYKVGPDEVGSSESEDSEAGAGEQRGLNSPEAGAQPSLYQAQAFSQMSPNQSHR